MKGIVLQGVSKKYEGDVILSDINLKIPGGKFFALLGPSGCGKTTILRMIAGLESLDAGAIFLGDQDITNVPVNQRSVNTVFQSYALFPHLNVFENIAYSLRIKQLSEDLISQKIEKVMRMFHLESLIYKRITQLSGGQQQRVAVARAVVAKPQLILADEPTGNLDSKNGEEVMGLLKQLNEEGTTVVMVTHSEKDALYSKRIIRLLDGKVV